MTDRNTNRPGYKKPPVGWIPEDWDTARLDQLADISTGNKDTRDRQIDGKYPFFVRSETIERINSHSYDGVAVLTAGDGVGTGKVFHYIDGKFDFHQRVYKVSDFSARLNSRYFFNYFRHNFLAQVTRYTAKNSVDSIRREMIAGMPIPLPPLPEQKKIAEILSTWDEGIEQTRQFIAVAKCRKKALMQKLLTGKKRLKGFKGKWKVFHLGDLCQSLASGGTPLTANTAYWQGAIPWVTGADIGEGNISYGRRFISSKALQDSNTVLCERGDLALVTRTGVGKWALIVQPTAVSQDITRIRFQPHIVDALFGGFAIASSIPNLLKFNQGTSIAGIQKDDLRHYALRIPPILEQRAIAAVLQTANEEIAALESKLAVLEKQKRGLMQKLLTGEVRVKPPRGGQHA